ncbi:hypothetical protein MMC19_002637 [Ptychographa xylographoides]|nr:hypothetical protein [Ptychographa xylographoides]
MAPNGDESREELGPFPWHLGVYDAHCHPTDTAASLKNISTMKARAITIMATRAQDQELVDHAARELGAKLDQLRPSEVDASVTCTVLPSFGWHPWFSHQIYDDMSEGNTVTFDKVEHYKQVITPPPGDHTFLHGLPEPRALSDILANTRGFLLKHPLALVGEIGLDRSFRIPENERIGLASVSEPESGLTPGTRDGRKLSLYRVAMNHQRQILKAQLNLAGEYGRAVSIHGVAAHGIVFETLQETWKGHERVVISKRSRRRQGDVSTAHDPGNNGVNASPNSQTSIPYPPRICMHSYSGSPEHVKQYFNPSIPAIIFFSFSQVINFSSKASQKVIEVIKVVPEDRILIESDIHVAGERMDDLLEQVARSVCNIKHWNLEEGVRQLSYNWKHFALGLEPDKI